MLRNHPSRSPSPLKRVVPDWLTRQKGYKRINRLGRRFVHGNTDPTRGSTTGGWEARRAPGLPT